MRCVDLLACSHRLCHGSHGRNCMLCIGQRRSVSTTQRSHSGHSGHCGAHRVVRAPAGASYASPTLSLPPSLADAECADVAMAGAKGADAEMAGAKDADVEMADVPFYFDPHPFHRSTVLDPTLIDLCSCFQIYAM